MVQQQSDGMLFWWFNMYGKDLFLPEKLDDGEEVTGSLQHHYLSLQVLQNRFWMFWTFFDVFCMTSYVSMCDLVQCLCFPTGQVLLHCICCALKEYEDDPNVAARPTRRNGSFRKWGCIKHDHIIYRMYMNIHLLDVRWLETPEMICVLKSSHFRFGFISGYIDIHRYIRHKHVAG